MLDFQVLKLLLNASAEELLPAFTPTQVAKLNAAFKLLWIMNCSNSEVKIIDTPMLAAQALSHHLSNRNTERFAVLVLDVKNQLLSIKVIAIGSKTECSADPSEVFSAIIRAGGKRAIVAHNHPSGQVEPSQADINMTKILLQGARILNLTILDHLIIGNGLNYRSLCKTTDLWNG